MGRRHRLAMALVAAAAVVLPLGTGCTSGGGAPGLAGPLAGAPGSEGSQLYATSAGVLWSFTASTSVGQVARSTDGGRTWQAVLPGSGPHTGLAMSASFFVGSDLGWVTHPYQRTAGARGAVQLTVVYGTADGGRRWWRSAPLPGMGTCDFLSDEIYFTDAQHGWLFCMDWFVQGDMVWQLGGALWGTSDGGHTWTRVHAQLPFQGAMDQDDETCPNGGPFHVAFANQQDGWLTASSCGAIGSAPRVWRTSDGGLTWTAAALPAPAGGWLTANDPISGVAVGVPWIVSSAGRAILLVAVSGPAGLVIESSADGGQTWHIAGQLAAGAPRYIGTSAFEPVDARQWVVSAPGRMIRTSDAGRTWQAIRSAASPGGPFWFTSVSRGYARGSAGVTRATSDGGRNWATAAAPPPPRPVPGPAVIAVQQISPSFSIASGPAGLRASHDGGRTWTPLALVPGPHPLSLAQFPDSQTGFVTDHFGKQLWRTTNGGSTWTPFPEPARVQIDHVTFWTPESGVAVTSAGDYRTTNGGVSWQPVALPRGYGFAPFWRIDQVTGARYPGQGDYPINHSTCVAGRTIWATAHAPGATGGEAVLVSTDDGTRWHRVLPPAVLRSPTVNARLTAWLGGCRGSQAWVEVMVLPYRAGAAVAYDVLRTPDDGRKWQDVLRIQNGATIPRLTLPFSPGALGPSPLPAGLAMIPEPLALTSASGAWLTLVATGGGLAFAVTADSGKHWHIRWYPPPQHAPRAAPAAPSGLPAGLPWLATTATDARHAWVLLASTNGSGASYLYATSDGGATWRRITTFRPAR